MSDRYCVTVNDRAGERKGYEFPTFNELVSWVQHLRGVTDPKRETLTYYNLDRTDAGFDGLTDEERDTLDAIDPRPLVATPDILLEQALLISIDAAAFCRHKPKHVLAAHWYRQGAKLFREAAEFCEKAAAKVDMEQLRRKGTAQAAEGGPAMQPKAAAPVPLGMGVVLQETEAERMGRYRTKTYNVEVPYDERGIE